MYKIGVLLVGQIRNLDIAIEYMKKEFDLGDDIQVDFFCHTWDRVVNFSPWNNLKNTDERFTDAIPLDVENAKQLFASFPQIVKYKIEDYSGLEYYYDNFYFPYPKKEIEFDEPGWKVFDHTSQIPYKDWSYYSSIIGQFYSSQEAMKMLVEYEKEHNINYDTVVRWRSDLASNVHFRDQNDRRRKWLFLPLARPNTIFVNVVQLWNRKISAADLFWHGDAPSMKALTLNLGIDYTRQLRKYVLQKKMVLNEEILSTTIRQLNLNLDSDSIGVIPIRPGATLEMTYEEIIDLADMHEKTKRAKAGTI